jgi:hypothetical protein
MLGERCSGEIVDGINIMFVNKFFYSVYSATSQILSDLAFHLAGSGRAVQVVAIQQIF